MRPERKIIAREWRTNIAKNILELQWSNPSKARGIKSMVILVTCRLAYTWLFGKRVRLHAKQMQNLCVWVLVLAELAAASLWVG